MVRRMGGWRTADKKRCKNFILGLPSKNLQMADKKYRKFVNFEKVFLWLCCENSFDTLLLFFGSQHLHYKLNYFLQVFLRVSAW